MKRVVAVDGGRGRVAGARLTVTPSRADADACLLPPPPLPSASRAPLLHRGRKLATELATQTPAGLYRRVSPLASGHDVASDSQNQFTIVSRDGSVERARASSTHRHRPLCRIHLYTTVYTDNVFDSVYIALRHGSVIL